MPSMMLVLPARPTRRPIVVDVANVTGCLVSVVHVSQELLSLSASPASRSAAVPVAYTCCTSGLKNARFAWRWARTGGVSPLRLRGAMKPSTRCKAIVASGGVESTSKMDSELFVTKIAPSFAQPAASRMDESARPQR